MRIVLASDHAGYEMKRQLIDYVCGLGYEVLDAGADSTDPVDYPDFAEPVADVIRCEP
jgi:ribose 5-phosphate isomerase B